MICFLWRTRALPVCVVTTWTSLRTSVSAVTSAGSCGRGLSGCAASIVFTTCSAAGQRARVRE